jgi:DNA-binding LacI/PurR family transcriptional regulator
MNPKEPAPSQIQIARLTGFSTATVSRALANHPLISAATKAAVRDAAGKLSYRPNPLVSTLTAQIRRSRISPTVSTLGYVTSAPLPSEDRNPWTEFYHGAREHAGELGYNLDLLWRREPGMTLRKFNGVLRARGIRGVIISPLSDVMGHITMDFPRLAAATVGHPLAKPRLHHASAWHLQCMNLALRMILKRGYKRIGYAIFPHTDRYASFSFSSRFLLYQSTITAKERIPLLVHPQEKRVPSRRQFETWFGKHSPDVILCSGPLIPDWIRELGLNVPQDVAYANLFAFDKESSESGIQEPSRLVGACAVDLVVEQIHQNRFGAPANPKSVLVEGEWVEGKTL